MIDMAIRDQQLVEGGWKSELRCWRFNCYHQSSKVATTGCIGRRLMSFGHRRQALGWLITVGQGSTQTFSPTGISYSTMGTCTLGTHLHSTGIHQPNSEANPSIVCPNSLVLSDVFGRCGCLL